MNIISDDTNSAAAEAAVAENTVSEGTVCEGAVPSDYQRVASAIDYIDSHAELQPSVQDIATHLQLSVAHVQRLFSAWAGISPKRFLQVLTLEHAKYTLRNSDVSIFEAADTLGLSSASRLYDHFVEIEAVTPGEYKNLGKTLSLRWACVPCPFGLALLAFTDRGISKLVFADDEREAITFVAALKIEWPAAIVIEDRAGAERLLSGVFVSSVHASPPLTAADAEKTEAKQGIKLCLRGTNFQLAVWRALLTLPKGCLVSYADIAQAIGKPKAVRAVGTAIGANPIAFIIPCHRVIRQSGALGGYRWGLRRKRALMVYESSGD